MWEAVKTSKHILKRPRKGGCALGCGVAASRPPAPNATAASRRSRNRRDVFGAAPTLQSLTPIRLIKASVVGGRHG